jgi:frataxin-like iron-binding protein CyaY
MCKWHLEFIFLSFPINGLFLNIELTNFMVYFFREKQKLCMKLLLPKLFFITLLISCFWLPENCFGQQPLTRKISFLEGLSSDVVYDLFVDKQGLLYLGTAKGLITYDGVHFDQIKIPETLGNAVNNIQQDHEGTIWCKNFANQLFFLKDGALRVEQKVKALLEQSDTNLVDFCLIKNSKYILTTKTLYHFVSGKIKPVFELKTDSQDGFNSITYDKESEKLYVSSGYFLLVFRNNILIEKRALSKNQKILEIFKGEIAYCTKSLDKSCFIQGQTISLENSGLDTVFLNRLTATKNALWLCSNKGIYKFDEKNKTFKNGFLKGVRITDIVQDFEGNHWISSLDEGLFMLPNDKIRELNLTSGTKRSYMCIAMGPNEHYFVGTNDGYVLEINNSGEGIREYKTKWENNIEFVTFIGDTILTNYGFFKIGEPAALPNNLYFGKNLKEDLRGNLLIASPSFGGLISRKLNGKHNFANTQNKFKEIKYGPNNLETLIFRNKRTKSILFDPSHEKYYYGFIEGLFVYSLDGTEKEIRTPDNQPLIAAEMILNEDGTIWVATSQKGVFLLKDDKVVRHLSVRNGLSDNNCTKIASDGNGLWIVTDAGFDYYENKTKRIKNAELNLCIKGITINDITIFKDFIILATNKGIYYFEKKVLSQSILPLFNFTDFLVNNKKTTPIERLSLKYNENNINIKFKTIHFKSLGNYSYRYRLIGLDDKWYTSVSAVQNVNFLALTPGVYKFQINIKIGERYTPIQEINFEIHKPFWLRIWFLSIVVLSIIAVMYFIYRWAEIKTRKGEELKEQLALSQLTALRSQMNPHFIFNVLNAVQGLIYSNQKSKASDYLGKFSELMRKILDTSDKNEVTIEKEFETIDLYVSLEKARFDNDFEYQITFPEGVDLNNYTIPSMIIQPFIENAIKHGLMHKVGFKKLDIKVELLEDVWCFTIDDNGIGRKASEFINQKIKKHISFATKAIDNRVKLINKLTNRVIDIEVIDKKSVDDDALGTRIKIYIPINH